MKDGIVLAVENLVHSKLLVPGANRRIQTIDRHIGLASNLFPVFYTFIEVLSRLQLVFLLMVDKSQLVPGKRLLTSAKHTNRLQH